MSFRAVAFVGALVAVGTGAELLLAQTTRVSVGSQGEEGDRGSYVPDLSADGRYVAFSSDATNLVPGDTNRARDIFVHDRQTGETTRVSINSQGDQGNQDCNSPAISADGRFVAFESWATNLVPGDTNDDIDVFVHDRQTGETVRASVDSQGREGNSASYCENGALSADGRLVTFGSVATNLVPGDTNGRWDVFVHDLLTGETTRASVSSQGVEGDGDSGHRSRPAISADGRFVAFESDASNLVPGDTIFTADVFVHDLQTGETTCASVSSSGAWGNGRSGAPNLSADGRWVVFLSTANNLVSADTNLAEDVFVHDCLTGETVRANVSSLGVQADQDTRWLEGRWFPVISADGHVVAFTSNATNLVWGDTNKLTDVYTHDLLTGSTMRVSVSSQGDQGNYGCNYGVAISDDGSVVAFASGATNLISGDTNHVFDVFVHEGAPGTCTVPASWNNYGKGWPGKNGIPGFVALTDPVLCATLQLHADNSAGVDTKGVLFAGANTASLVTPWGGTLLVQPMMAMPVPVPAGGLSLDIVLPCDVWLCGLPLFAQLIEMDAAASRDVSFTPGLQLTFGAE